MRVATKVCRRCKKEKDASDFFKEKRVRDGLASWCKICKREYHSKWYRDLRKTQPRARTRRTDRDNALRTKYGLTADDVDKMIVDQGGVCLTCGSLFGENMRPCVDHDHRVGHVRGILCRNCNTILGLAKEDPIRLRALARYVDPMYLGNRVHGLIKGVVCA